VSIAGAVARLPDVQVDVHVRIVANAEHRRDDEDASEQQRTDVDSQHARTLQNGKSDIISRSHAE
jgi:hypothetical protein